MLDLTWDRVDLESRRIDFNTAEKGQGNKRRAIVPINETAFKALTMAYELATTHHVIEWAGNPCTTMNKAFNKTRDEAGLGKDVTPHILRHTAATHMAKAGVDMFHIAGMLGHNNIATTAKVYARHHPDFLKNAASALDDFDINAPRGAQLKVVKA